MTPPTDFCVDLLTHLTTGNIILDSVGRLLCSSVLSYLVGSERSTKQKVAGIRTHCLLANASCLATLAGALLCVLQPGNSEDPTRLAGQILTGIGFVGAGAIVRRGYITVGLTTAGTIFLAACVGVACGLGFPILAALVFFLLTCLSRLIAKFHQDDEAPSNRFLKIRINADELAKAKALLPSDAKLRSVDQVNDLVDLVIVLKSRSWEDMDILLDSLSESVTLKSFEIQTY